MKNEYMPFGSAMNSFGLINKGKGMSADEFIIEMNKIMDAAKEFEKPLNSNTNDFKPKEIQLPK